MRPRAGLGRVLDDLGSTLLTLGHGQPQRGAEIGGVVIHDPADRPDLPPHALVLGVGLRDAEEITALLPELGRQQVAALIVRAPVPHGDAVAAAAEESGVAVLGLTPGASWTQLVAILRSLLAEGDVGVVDAESLGGIPSGDLFALANAVSALLDAPITVEDRSSRVLAFSGRQDEADQSRIETILGRQVPEKYTRMLAERGVFRRLYRDDEPVWIDPLPLGRDEQPRVAVAVRAGDEVLGSIWAAVREPLSQDRLRALRDAAKLVALHMLRIRAGADVERRLRTDLLSTALEGGAGARDALSRLGLAHQPVVVLALTTIQQPGSMQPGPSDAGLATERQQLSDGFAMHLSAVHARSAAALVGDVAYGLLPLSGDAADGEDRAARIAAEFLGRVGHRDRAAIAVGPVARDVAELAYARTTADRVVRVLRSRHGSGPRVARLGDVTVEALVLELRDLVTARGDGLTGAVAKLWEYDKEHNGRMVETLHAWLDAFGDVTVASASLHVHPNTLRYRLRRLSALGGLDLDDADARFAAMLQLRIFDRPLASAARVAPEDR
ncbi:PucR family transcriptional regulator [Jiangella ureilytica]|uniref:PucR family transcriptional regulator n=1 Tax=Jiangella ureilytica TaxID=2530374 RepID=A0A4R4RUH5_9ACTN|nr:helix-turn-helix domain-containing protein [Jiangella ureilytica]TDC53314.1 PucR family transcriptional regulator [Jiangella ureilytica]